MAADAPPSSSVPRGPPTTSGVGDGPGAAPHSCSPDELYFHVVGKWPGSELGYPADHTDGQGPSGAGSMKPVSPTDDMDDRRDGSNARAKKRRKVQRRAKVSEIWFPHAEMAFCTCVSSIPPNGRTKIKFFGRPLGRNELIAAICTLATRRLYNRKQISSHSQVLKDKVPHPYKEIFTFEDKARSDETGESSTANVIENYTFPDAIYNVIGYRVGTDLANSPKPDWLVRLEAGGSEVQAQQPAMDASASGRPYSYWANNPADQYSGYYDRGGQPAYLMKGKERDGRAPMHPHPSQIDSSYYQYGQQSLRQQQPPYGSSSYQGHIVPPHTLPPLPASRDLDDHQSPLAQHTTMNDPSGVASRYGYASHPQMPQRGQRISSTGQVWDGVDHSRSPTNSTFEGHSQGSSGLSPRDSMGPPYGDVKPSMSGGDHLTLPPLQEVPSPQYNDWQWAGKQQQQPVVSTRGGGLPGLPNLPSLGSVASQAYALPSAGGWSGSSSGGYQQQPWDDPRDRQRTPPSSVPRSLAAFVPSGVEFTAQTREHYLSLSPGEPLANGPPIPMRDIYMYKNRYPFLDSIAASPAPVPVFHIDIPVAFGANLQQRRNLIQRTTAFGLHLLLRPLGDANGWALTTDTAFLHTQGAIKYMRTIEQLRINPTGDLSSDTRITDLVRLYDQLLAQERGGDSFSNVGAPMSVVVQRIIRDNGGDRVSTSNCFGEDWADASVVLIYTFWADNRQPFVCRPVDFDQRGPPQDVVAADQLVADLLAGEEQQPSKFEWM